MSECVCGLSHNKNPEITQLCKQFGFLLLLLLFFCYCYYGWLTLQEINQPVPGSQIRVYLGELSMLLQISTSTANILHF